MKTIDIWKRLNEIGVNKSLADINNALSQIDQAAIFDEQKTRFHVEIWDKKSPINGVPAAKILERGDIPAGGEVYLVYVDGQLQYLQPHDPFQAGIVAMTPETVQQIANSHVEQLATQAADERTFELVLEKLLG